MKLITIIFAILITTGCATRSGDMFIVDAKVLSSKQFCESKSADSTEVGLAAIAGGAIGSQLGGGRMKYVNGFIGAVAASEMVKANTSNKVTCRKYLNILEMKHPYSGQKIKRKLVTNHKLNQNTEILYETRFKDPYN